MDLWDLYCTGLRQKLLFRLLGKLKDFLKAPSYDSSHFSHWQLDICGTATLLRHLHGGTLAHV